MTKLLKSILMFCGGMLCAGCAVFSPSSASSGDDIFSRSSLDAELVRSMLPHAEQYVTPYRLDKDISQRLLPTDVLSGARLVLLQVDVESTLTKKCMDKAGYPQYVRSTDASAPFPETSPSVSQVFNVAVAQKYGYRDAPDPTFIALEVTRNDEGYESQPAAFHEAWRLCMSEASDLTRGALGIQLNPEEEEGEKTPRQELFAEANKMHVDTSESELQTAAGKWRECMSPLGIVDLPSEPDMFGAYERIPESLREKWGWTAYGEPSAEEIRFAVHDAQCRESSGWAALYYDAEWEVANSIMQGHDDLVRSIQEEQRQMAAALLALKGSSTE